ncbi:MAG: Uma2 family endonuclease, partial [Thermomicrobiales bacterium]
LYTVEDLEALGGDVPYELIRGELREVSPASMRPSVITGRIHVRVALHVDERDLGYVTSAEGGFVLLRDPDVMVAPDVGFIRANRLPHGIEFDGFCPVPPDFAVEVMSPSDRPGKVQEKIDLYLEAGVPLVWWVKTRERTVAVYRPGQPTTVYRGGDILDGAPVLPDFRLAVSDIFR